MNESFAEFASFCPDEHLDHLRELLAFDVLCPASSEFVRGEYNRPMLKQFPSPFHWSRQAEWPWVLHHIGLKSHHTVLDIGSGWSVLKFPIAKRCSSLLCLDHDKESLRIAGNTIEKLGFKNIQQVLGDARNLPFLDDSFDRVVCCSVLEHIPSLHLLAVAEAVRVLKPGGMLLLTMDVVMDGAVGEKEFHVSIKEASEILGWLGFTETIDTPTVTSEFEDGKIRVAVLMVKWVKPKKEAQ